MKARHPLLIALIALICGCGPSTWDECILENMRGVQSDVAARAIGAACDERFPQGLKPYTGPVSKSPEPEAQLSPVDAAKRAELVARRDALQRALDSMPDAAIRVVE